MSLFRLAYVSTSLLDHDPERQREQIANILIVSRPNNEQLDITGALLTTATHFAQILEGERDVVESLYGCIRCDVRHDDVVLLLAESIEQREFPQWAMAYIGPSQCAEDAVQRLALGVPTGTEHGARARTLLSFMSGMVRPEASASAA